MLANAVASSHNNTQNVSGCSLMNTDSHSRNVTGCLLLTLSTSIPLALKLKRKGKKRALQYHPSAALAASRSGSITSQYSHAKDDVLN